MSAAAVTLAVGYAALPAPAMAQAAPNIAEIIVYGNDPCPRGANGEEIVVCARKPETERYRIPKELRDAPSTDPASQSWANKAESLEYVGRTGIQSCSTVGPGGWTGCFAKMLSEARQERRQAAAEAARAR